MFHACSSQSMAIVTAYDNLGESGVEHSLLQSKADAVFVDPNLLKIIGGPLTKAKTVRFLIYNEESNNRESGDDEEIGQFKAAHPDLTVLSFGDLRALGEAHPTPPVEPSPEDMCCIMYTSGSTGPPKGVPVTHATFVAAVAGLYAVIEGVVSHREFVLAYLPLAHIFELVLENLALFVGATLGYGSPRTLSDVSMRNCYGDMRAFRPTIMVGVPQVWETVKKGIEAKVQAENPIIRGLFWAGVRVKSFLVRHNLPGASLIDRFVFSQVSESTGGRLRFIVNGASAISDPTRHFMSMVVAPMLNGYGLTETCGNGAMGNPLQWTPGSSAVGPIPAAVEVKLVAIPELNYSTDTTPPQGEILIRGGSVIKEYFENPEETAKAITPDGWFRSGDIGQFEANGHLAIIDRVKNLVKLQGGEYIALEKLEAIYLGSATVEQIMVHGDSSSPRPIGVVVVKDKQVEKVAAGVGVGGGPDDMRKDAKVRGAVLKELQGLAKREGLSAMETLSGVVLVDGPWDPKDVSSSSSIAYSWECVLTVTMSQGLVTATQKINRKAVRERFAKEIKACVEGK